MNEELRRDLDELNELEFYNKYCRNKDQDKLRMKLEKIDSFLNKEGGNILVINGLMHAWCALNVAMNANELGELDIQTMKYAVEKYAENWC